MFIFKYSNIYSNISDLKARCLKSNDNVMKHEIFFPSRRLGVIPLFYIFGQMRLSYFKSGFYNSNLSNTFNQNFAFNF